MQKVLDRLTEHKRTAWWKYLTICGLLIGASLTLFWPARSVKGQASTVLLLSGGGSETIVSAFIDALAEKALSNPMRILVIPAALGTPDLNSEAEDALLDKAEAHRKLVQSACESKFLGGRLCQVEVVPVFKRSAAQSSDLTRFFPNNLAGVYFVNGDTHNAMQIIRGTLLEALLIRVYQNGAVFAGSGAGAIIQAPTLITGLHAGKGPSEVFEFQAVEIGLSQNQRGLPLGLPDLVLEQMPLSSGNLGKLLSALTSDQGPTLGLGLELESGAVIQDNSLLKDSFGRSLVVVLDSQTYQAAAGVQYNGQPYTLSLRNVLFHTLAPGFYTYDLKNRKHSLGPPALIVERSFSALTLPDQAGELILSGGGLEVNPSLRIMNHFLNLSGGKKAEIFILIAGFQDIEKAEAISSLFQASLGVSVVSQIIPAGSSELARIPNTATGIIMLAEDPALIMVSSLAPVRTAWLSGKPVLADGAAAAILCRRFSTAAVVSEQSTAYPIASITPGANFLNVSIVSNLLSSPAGWANLVALAAFEVDLPAFGLETGSALVVGQDGAYVMGDKPVVSLDLRQAKLAISSNGAFVIANGLLDIYAPGDRVSPERANLSYVPVRLGTPVLPTASSTPSPILPTPTPAPTVVGIALTTTQTMTASPTLAINVAVATARTAPATKIQPTAVAQSTPEGIVEPLTEQRVTQLIILSALAVLTIFLGVALNRGNHG